MARECQNHAFLADHLGKADSVVANLDTEVRMAQGFCRRRSRGTYALSVLGTCGKDGRRCRNWKQWTLRAGRRQNGEGALRWWWTWRRSLRRFNAVPCGNRPCILTLHTGR